MKSTKSSLAFLAISLLWIIPSFASAPPGEDGARDHDVAAKAVPAQQEIIPVDNQSIEGLEIEVRPDGILKVDLLGRFQHVLAVRIDPDGSEAIGCIDDAEAMAAFLAAAVKASFSTGEERAEK